MIWKYYVDTEDLYAGRVKITVYVLVRNSKYVKNVEGILRSLGFQAVRTLLGRAGPVTIGYKIVPKNKVKD